MFVFAFVLYNANTKGKFTSHLQNKNEPEHTFHVDTWEFGGNCTEIHGITSDFGEVEQNKTPTVLVSNHCLGVVVWYFVFALCLCYGPNTTQTQRESGSVHVTSTK